MPEKTLSSTPSRRQIFRALEAKSLKSRSRATKVADFLTSLTSTPTFLFLNIAFFAAWIIPNVGLIPGIQPFDPFPFGLLTMVVSLEAIMLSIFVLVSQNRAAQIATLREELHLRINLIAEQEITKSLQILARMEKKMGIKEKDEELEKMLENIDTSTLEKSIIDQIDRADQSPLSRFDKKEFSNLIKSLTSSEK